jgi:hypothetical protein
MDEFIDCLAEGGDADAFVEARQPREPEPPPAPRPDEDPDLTAIARVAGVPDYRGVHANDIPVEDLDPTRQEAWDLGQWVRAFRSGFMTWLEIMAGSPGFRPGHGSPPRFAFARRAAEAAAEAGESCGPDSSTDDLDPKRLWDWSDDQLARGWSSGFLKDLPVDFWDALARDDCAEEEEE